MHEALTATSTSPGPGEGVSTTRISTRLSPGRNTAFIFDIRTSSGTRRARDCHYARSPLDLLSSAKEFALTGVVATRHAKGISRPLALLVETSSIRRSGLKSTEP